MESESRIVGPDRYVSLPCSACGHRQRSACLGTGLKSQAFNISILSLISVKCTKKPPIRGAKVHENIQDDSIRQEERHLHIYDVPVRLARLSHELYQLKPLLPLVVAKPKVPQSLLLSNVAVGGPAICHWFGPLYCSVSGITTAPAAGVCTAAQLTTSRALSSSTHRSEARMLGFLLLCLWGAANYRICQVPRCGRTSTMRKNAA